MHVATGRTEIGSTAPRMAAGASASARARRAHGRPITAASEIAPGGKLRVGMIAITVLAGVAEPVARFVGQKLGAAVEPIAGLRLALVSRDGVRTRNAHNVYWSVDSGLLR